MYQPKCFASDYSLELVMYISVPQYFGTTPTSSITMLLTFSLHFFTLFFHWEFQNNPLFFYSTILTTSELSLLHLAPPQQACLCATCTHGHTDSHTDSHIHHPHPHPHHQHHQKQGKWHFLLNKESQTLNDWIT